MSAKIIVDRVNGTPNIYQGVSKKTGKPYTLYTFSCNGIINGQGPQTFFLKTLSEKTGKEVNDGYVCDAEEQIYQGKISYMIQKAGSYNSGDSKTSYSFNEYNELYRYAVNIAWEALNQSGVESGRIDAQALASLSATYIISAVNNGIKVEHLSTIESSGQRVANIMKGQVVNQNPDQPPLNENDIPFQ